MSPHTLDWPNPIHLMTPVHYTSNLSPRKGSRAAPHVSVELSNAAHGCVRAGVARWVCSAAPAVAPRLHRNRPSRVAHSVAHDRTQLLHVQSVLLRARSRPVALPCARAFCSRVTASSGPAYSAFPLSWETKTAPAPFSVPSAFAAAACRCSSITASCFLMSGCSTVE